MYGKSKTVWRALLKQKRQQKLLGCHWMYLSTSKTQKNKDKKNPRLNHSGHG